MKMMTTEKKTKIELMIQVAISGVLATITVVSCAVITSPYGVTAFNQMV